MTATARAWALVAVAVAVVVAAALLSGGGAGGTTIEQRAHDVASQLRCPVCQNLSVADSPSGLAGEMRSDIEDQVRAGRTDREIEDFYVSRYGEWVLLEPTRSGLNALPWALPVAALAVGVALWVRVVRRRPGEEA